MSRSNNKLFITVGAIGLIALACLNWLIVVCLLFLALIIWLASNDINNGGSRYTSSYTRSNQEYKEPKSPLEYSSSPHYIQQKAKHVADSIKAFIDNIIDKKAGLVSSNDLFSFGGVVVLPSHNYRQVFEGDRCIYAGLCKVHCHWEKNQVTLRFYLQSNERTRFTDLGQPMA